MEFPKIENLFKRDEETHLMLPRNGFRMEEIDLIGKWLVLEKIDGMNMRVIYEPYNLALEPDEDCGPEYKSVHIYGRTDRAVIPGDLMDRMTQLFNTQTLSDCFSEIKDVDGVPTYVLPKQVVLFGEGYGPGIQQGGHYGDAKDFMLFDVVIDGRWQRWSVVEEIACALRCATVPVLARDVDLEHVHWMVERLTRDGSWASLFGCITETPEGVIARTDPYLFDGRGRRIMFKHKVRDVVKMLENDDELAGSA